jgi:hypothetical protein
MSAKISDKIRNYDCVILNFNSENNKFKLGHQEEGGNLLDTLIEMQKINNDLYYPYYKSYRAKH